MQTAPSTGHRAGRSRVVALLALVALALGGLAVRADASTPAAKAGAGWLAGQVGASGYVEGPGGTPAVGATLDVALALASAEAEEPTFDRMVAWLTTNVETVIAGGGTDSPGSIGNLLLVLDAAGLGPVVGGVDLVARLNATLGAHSAGLYGADDPTYDGVYRQGLALLGLAAHGVTPPAAAVSWLVGQQCDGTAPDALGGWMAYRADTSVACPAPDPMTYAGPDTNQTALALLALSVLGVAPTHDAVAFLAAAQGADGGFPYLSGGSVDPNSTSLVILALRAAGQDLGTAPWADGDATPTSSLASWIIASGADAGALASPYSGGAVDPFATRQGVWGLSGATFPLGPVTFPSQTTTTTGGTPTTAPDTTSTTLVRTAPPAQPVPGRPAYTG